MHIDKHMCGQALRHALDLCDESILWIVLCVLLVVIVSTLDTWLLYLSWKSVQIVTGTHFIVALAFYLQAGYVGEDVESILYKLLTVNSQKHNLFTCIN